MEEQITKSQSLVEKRFWTDQFRQLCTSRHEVRKAIPHVVHQMWIDKKNRHNQDPPSKYLCERFCGSFKLHNPDWDFVFWNRAKMDALLELPCFRKYKKLINALPVHIQLCDVFRIMIMYIWGGVYCDLDITCHRSLDSLVDGREIVLTHDILNHSQGTLEFLRKNNVCVWNGFLASCPRHPMWLEYLDFIMCSFEPGCPKVMKTTGPGIFGTFMSRRHTNVDKKPEWYISNDWILPFNAFKRRRNLNVSNYYLSTYWTEGSAWGASPSYIANVALWDIMHNKFMFLLILIIILLVIFRRKGQECRSCHEKKKKNTMISSFSSSSSDMDK